MSKTVHPSIARLMLVLAEQRHDLGFSQRETARFSRVSRPTIARIERGDSVDPALVVQVAATLNTIELAAAPAPVLAPVPDLQAELFPQMAS